jgi:hypothetical protein
MPRMTPAAALAEAKRIAATGVFFISNHAALRMRQRTVKRPDIQAAIASAVSAADQGNEKWLVEGGLDTQGDGLTLVVLLDGGMMIVTVY